jgi:hypothetical protein
MQGDLAKAKAHMARAIHYGYKRSAFGGPTDVQMVEPVPAAAPYVTERDGKVSLVFILAPLNDAALVAIREEINASVLEGCRVEVYMQAFSEDGLSPENVLKAVNLLPMNFNQYSSDNPYCLVELIDDYASKTSVEFFIFPTQTTKNAHFLGACKKKFLEKLNELVKNKDKEGSYKISPWILAAIVSWLRKDEAGSFTRLTTLGELIKEGPALLSEMVKNLQEAGIHPFFDPFCVHWASYRGQGVMKATAVPVLPYVDGGETERDMKKPRFRPGLTRADGTPTNCFYVTWAGESALSVKADALIDADTYIEDLWNSFKMGVDRSARRKVHRKFIGQDYYDYDNKFGVWYALDSIDAASVHLFSVSRPVADKGTMVNMRRDLGAGAIAKYTQWFNFDVTPPTMPRRITDDKSDAKFPMSPVILSSEYEAGAAAVNADTSFLPVPETLEGLGAKLYDRRAALKESEEIAFTWVAFLCHYIRARAGSTGFTYIDGSWKVTNGGHTSRHGMHPVMHTLVEDWLQGHPAGLEMPPKTVHSITHRSAVAVGDQFHAETGAAL